MKKKMIMKDRVIWRIKLFLFLCLIGQAVFFLFLPIIQSGKTQYLSQQQQTNYKRTMNQMNPRQRKEITRYERNYNEYLTTNTIQKQSGIAHPSKHFFKQTNEIMGFLSSPIVGLGETTIDYDSQAKTKDVPFVQRPLSSLPENSGNSTCMVVDLKKGWRFQEFISTLQQLKKGDSLFLDTHYGKDEYEILSTHSKVDRGTNGYRRYFLSGGNHLVIFYQSPISGSHEIIAKRVAKNPGKRLVIKRQYFSYSKSVSLLFCMVMALFFLLVYSYQRSIGKFYTNKERVRQTTRKYLYVLLQGTKAYFLIVGLAAAVFLLFIGYVYGLF